MSKTMKVYNFDIASQDTRIIIHLDRNSADNLIISGNAVQYLDFNKIGIKTVQSIHIEDDNIHLILYEDETERAEEAEGE